MLHEKKTSNPIFYIWKCNVSNYERIWRQPTDSKIILSDKRGTFSRTERRSHIYITHSVCIFSHPNWIWLIGKGNIGICDKDSILLHARDHWNFEQFVYIFSYIYIFLPKFILVFQFLWIFFIFDTLYTRNSYRYHWVMLRLFYDTHSNL